jgi:Ca2+ transporting ATPase
VLIVQFGGEVFMTKPLSAQQWAACIGIGALSLLVRAGLRLLPPHPEAQDAKTSVY